MIEAIGRYDQARVISDFMHLRSQCPEFGNLVCENSEHFRCVTGKCVQYSLSSFDGEIDWSYYTSPYINKKPTEQIINIMKDTYIHRLTYKQFPESWGWRFIRLDPKITLDVHCDNVDSGAARRIHIPIITNPSTWFSEWSTEPSTAGSWSASVNFYHMRPGRIWKVNVDQPHSACNYGEEPRWHLVGMITE